MIDCPFRTPLGTCQHIDAACGRPVQSYTATNGKILQFGEDACRYCIKTSKSIEARKHSKPVADWIKNAKGEKELEKAECVHRGTFVRSNEAKRHCGACAYYECNKDHGEDGIIRPDLHCGKQCPDFVQIIKEPAPPKGVCVGTMNATSVEDGDTVTVRYAATPNLETVREVWVAGYPSPLGGADTELDHQIRLWRSKGLPVNLVPTGTPPAATKERMDALGCTTHQYHPAIFAGKIVVSFCNGEFLKRLPAIMQTGRPLKVIWANCMCWTTPAERQAVKAKWIDLHLFQTKFQEREVTQNLGRVKSAPYVPYFDPGSLAPERKPTDYFGLGRISRDDPAKFSLRTWPLLDAIRAPVPTKAFILGHSDNVAKKIGTPPPSTDYMLWPAGGIESAEFYRRVHCIVHATDNSRENLPRVLLEAWATGTIFIAEDNYGFPELIQDGVNGFLCRSPEHMAATATMVASDEALRERVVEGGLKSLDRFSAAKSWATWERVLFGAATDRQTLARSIRPAVPANGESSLQGIGMTAG